MARTITCDCNAIAVELQGPPRVRAYCHCKSCRALSKSPFGMLTAWEPDKASIARGQDQLIQYKLPDRAMKRCWCSQCGVMLFNTNKYDFCVVPMMLLRDSDGSLPESLRPEKHIFYDSRVVSIIDDLPKYLQGVDGPLFEGK